MTAKMKNTTYNITAGKHQFSFLPSGDIFEASYGSILINQTLSNPIDGSLNNIYLRIHREGERQVYPLLGVDSKSEFAISDKHALWTGIIEDIQYQVNFHLTELGVWFWDVQVEGEGVEFDLIYGQDLGIADKDAVQNNEAYISQYMDHKIFEDDQKGYVICSRQNMEQSTGYPYIQQGSLSRLAGYSTDGFQFFGKSYKETNQPEALTRSLLANEVYQYEFAYTALQSEKIKLSGKSQFVFYGLFKENHASVINELEYGKLVTDAWNQVGNQADPTVQQLQMVNRIEDIGAPLSTGSVTYDELNHYFPNRHQEEWEGDTLLSFFTETHEHVVLKEKELLVERPHGHILMNGNNEQKQENTITSTSWMYGVFNAQLVVGNTNFNKLLTNARNALNVSKTSGQRIYVEINGNYHLMTMPSIYEIGFNYTRWYYKSADETFVITNYTMVDQPEVRLHVKAMSGRKYRYLVTNQIIMHVNEYEVPYHMTREGKVISFTADTKSSNADIYPELKYQMQIEGTTFDLTNETRIVSNIQQEAASLLVCELDETNEWEITVQGLLYGGKLPFEKKTAAAEIKRYRKYLQNVMSGFRLSQQGNLSEKLNKVNTLAWWYTHNMLVHYSVPHGLEQYSAAAWGTRDVCQSPAEYFMATQNFQAVKEIIRTVYSHQFEEDGNWPQWFMFDKFTHIQADESHGDIIVWPLKVLSDYLAATKDYSILDEKLPYTRREDFEFTKEKATIYDHAKKEINYIREHFLHDTHLSAYGGGDWDDTLQPANAQLKHKMASSWTVALTYQVIQKFSKVLEGADQSEAVKLAELASDIEKDFKHYMLRTDVIPGFIYMEKSNQTEMMLHPNDTKTGIEYRLLPMQRGIISELFTPEQAENHYQIIKEKLYCPDGVRLMNRPANYTGGISRHFKRAEQAANFGREIGLQYVHAHIRFVEAMAKLGKEEEVWKGLEMINPIGIQDVVPNAEVRQSNTYFSSSDGKFNTRYDAQENFGKLRDGTVAVKGGWRIYSSGPGIYMNQLISNCLGIRQEAGELVIDPVLPDSFDGLIFDYQFNGYQVTFVYHLSNGDKGIVINDQVIENTKQVSNRYRQGGYRVTQQDLEAACTNESNIIDIYL